MTHPADTLHILCRAKRALRASLFLACALAGLTACEDDPGAAARTDGADNGKEATFLLYLVGQNNLSDELNDNINDLMTGYEASGANANVLVYADFNTAPELYLLEKDRQGNVRRKTLKTYPDQYSVDPEVMRTVLSDVFDNYPAARRGLTLSSHASGSLYGYPTVSKRAFGTEGNYTMNITDLREALSDCPRLDLVMFDACLMASAETAYELKDCARYLLAAPNIIPSPGFPYDSVFSDLVRMDSAGLTAAARGYMAHYHTDELWGQLVAISLTDLSRMDTLALYMDSLFQSPDVQAHPSTLDRNRLQRFEYGFQLYDFGEWVDSVGRGSPYLSKVRAALDRAIIYESHGAYASFTEYGQPIIPVKDGAFCGLNTYVPPLLPYYSEESQRTFFTTLRWYRDAGLWRSDAYNRYETQATGQ